jgi:phospholipase C
MAGQEKFAVRADTGRMKHAGMARAYIAALACSFAVLTGCGGSSGAQPTTGPLPNLPPAKAGKNFTHIVILIQENRTYDNLFATFPGGDGTTEGKGHDGSIIPLVKADLENHISPNNGYTYWIRDWNNGQMNGFDQVNIGPVSGRYVYQYVDPAQIEPYWALARQYVLSDHMFQTQGTGSFTAHQDLIAGGAMLDSAHSFIDFPSIGPVWGCDSPSDAKTSLIDVHNAYMYNQGPFPCLTHETLRDPLDANGISWRYYAPEVGKSFGGDLWNAFDAVKAVRYGSEWNTNVTWPETNFFKDVSAGKLPSVSWVIPEFQNSDHPGAGSDTGPSWVAQVVNAVGNSPDWKTTAIVVTWDDWGGWYDHVRPPGQQAFGGLGFRLPMLVISPYARKGYVTHKQYEFGTIVKFVEDNWDLGRLGNTDVRAASMIDDVFDFKQTPRPFQTIQAQYSKEYFMHQKPGKRTIETDD